MFNKIQSVNQNLKENVRTNQKQILEKMGLKFHKLESDMYFVAKSVSLLELGAHEGPKLSLWNK